MNTEQTVDDVLDIWESVFDRVNPLPAEKRPVWRDGARKSITPDALVQFQRMSREEIESMLVDVLGKALHAEARPAKEGGSR